MPSAIRITDSPIPSSSPPDTDTESDVTETTTEIWPPLRRNVDFAITPATIYDLRPESNTHPRDEQYTELPLRQRAKHCPESHVQFHRSERLGGGSPVMNAKLCLTCVVGKFLSLHPTSLTVVVKLGLDHEQNILSIQVCRTA